MTDSAPAGVNVGALLAEAATKSSVAWIITTDEQGAETTHPVWFAYSDERFLVVSGPGEQHLPWLPPEVRIALRSKDSGGRLLTVHARAEILSPHSERWEAAVSTLTPLRLNAVDDLATRWAEQCTIHEVSPYGAPVDAPGQVSDGDGRRPVRPAKAARARWRPWHLGGRPQRRRGT